MPLGGVITLPHQDLLETARLLMCEAMQGTASDAMASELLSGVIQHYVADADRHALGNFASRYGIVPEEMERWVRVLRDRLHLLVYRATGGLIPSYRYQGRLALTGADVGITITASLPTLEDALEHLRNTREDDYLPARYRR